MSNFSSKTPARQISTKSRATYRSRRIATLIAILAAVIGFIFANPNSYEQVFDENASASASTDAASDNTTAASDHTAQEVATSSPDGAPLALDILEQLAIKGRAPKTGYSRDEFYSDWPKISGCSLRQIIIKREVGDSATLASDNCTVLAGTFTEPYTGKALEFTEKSQFSKGIQIDHVVALSDAWQKGAQNLDKDTRYQLATDPLNLIAADSSANQQKSDGDAATWLPSNKTFRCQYVARQVSVKYKYNLWVTQAEHDAIAKILTACPSEPAIGVEL